MRNSRKYNLKNITGIKTKEVIKMAGIKTTITDNAFALAGFTSGSEGIWSRNEPQDPPTSDYLALSDSLGIALESIIRPYQAGGDNAVTVSADNGGSGVIRDSDLKKTDGLITAEKGLVLSIIAADCVPVYLISEKAKAVGLLHCGWRSAAGDLIHNGIEKLKVLGAVPSEIQVIIGPHICTSCYKVGAEVYTEYASVFSEKELERIFESRCGNLYLDLAKAIQSKLTSEGISNMNISESDECTCHNARYYSYRRGDRGKQNLAFIMIK